MTAFYKISGAREPIRVVEKNQQKLRDFREDFDIFEYRFSIPFLKAEKDIIKICRSNRIITKLLKS